MLESSLDGSSELIASIMLKDALIILFLLDVIINHHKEAVKIV